MKKILLFLRVHCLVRAQAKCRRASPTRPGTGPAAEPNHRGGAPDYHLPVQVTGHKAASPAKPPGKEMEPAPGVWDI